MASTAPAKGNEIVSGRDKNKLPTDRAATATGAKVGQPNLPKVEEVWVKKWVDYSTKYGLGYLLSDGSTGVYFNDSTKIILDKNSEVF